MRDLELLQIVTHLVNTWFFGAKSKRDADIFFSIKESRQTFEISDVPIWFFQKVVFL